MSNSAKSKAVALAAKIAGQSATIAAHGVPVGPLAEEVVGDLLGELLDVQDEQLATLRNIEKSVTRIGQDVAQLVEGPYRTAREMMERAMIPRRVPDQVKVDLRAASDEFLRAAGQHSDATLPRASAYMEASFVQGLLGDAEAMRYYGDKAWKEAVAALRREARNAADAIRHPTDKARRGRRSFWSCLDDREFRRKVHLLEWGEEEWGESGEDLAETFPEARAVQNVRETKRQVDVYRGVAANLLDGPDVLPYHMVRAHLRSQEHADVVILEVYDHEQIRSCREALASLLRKLGINEHLYANSFCHDDGLWSPCPWTRWVVLETITGDDPRAVAFEAEVKQIFPYGLRLVDSPKNKHQDDTTGYYEVV